MKRIKKPISILLAVLMVFGVFAVVPFTASAAIGDFVPESEYLTFTAVEAGSTVTLGVVSGNNNLQYDLNGTGLTGYTAGTTITLANEGDSVRFRGKDTTFDDSNFVSIGGKVACSGNVMSLRLDDNGMVQGLSYYCFYCMFMGCTGLTAAPELPETMLAEGCYSYMFYGCTSLTTAPALPATNLAKACYFGMFYDCDNLTTAPKLPATTLAEACYYEMFYDCDNLTTAPALPATNLAEACYYHMFADCSSIMLSTEQTAEYSIPYSVPSGGNGTPASSALTGMFTNTGGTFKGTPTINTTYYRPLEKYTVTWKNEDGTVIDTTTVAEGDTPTHADPIKPDDAQYTYTFSGWKNGTTTYAANALPEVTGDVTYTAQFTSEARTFMVIVKKTLTGETINVYDVSGETTVAQLKDILASQTGAPASAQRLIFAGRQLENDKQLSEYNIQKESTIHLIISTYTVTWKNWNNDELYVDPTVPAGVTPTYPYENPTRPEDDANTYTFSNWDPDVQPVTGPAEYKATYTAVPKPKTLIAGHSLSLDGNIGINFYLDPSVAGLTAQKVNAGNLSYTFAWADVETTKAKVNVADQAKEKKFRVSEDGKYIIITCHVCAAEMTCDVDATFKLGDKTASETYSVRKYCDTVLHPTAEWLNAYKEKYPDGTAKCYNNLEKLVEAMLNYGAKAQTKFKVNTGTPGSSDTPGTPGKLANEGVTYNPGDVTTEKLEKAIAKANPNETAANMNNVAAALGAKWFSTSLIYLDDSTLRHYFVKATDTFKPSDYKASKSNYYYYVEKTDIPAAELDNLQSFTAGTQTFKYSALDFVKGMINSSADGDSKNLAKSLYWYNQAANDYFPAPAPVQNIVHLDALPGVEYEAKNGDVLTGTLTSDKKITIADGATVTLKDVDITNLGMNCDWAGINCPGNATLVLEGENTVCAGLDGDGYNKYPGIWIAKDKTLTIEGNGSLTAYSNNTEPSGAGIGGGYRIAAGNIVIKGGTVTANGGYNAAGIGSGDSASCGNITITGGTITATGGDNAAGIGSGEYASCGNITINGGNVTANGIYNGAGIGSGYSASCETITINGGTVTANGGAIAAGIGSGYDDATCGNITITGGTITANGGVYAAGIGSGYDDATCGNITIADTVTQVTATKGEDAPNSIGAGEDATCGDVTIAPGANVTQN